MQFHWLSKRDARRLAETVSDSGLKVSGDRAAVISDEDVKLFQIGGYIIIETLAGYVPLVDESVNGELLNNLPSVIVDMGAVQHVVNGADVMRPGIVTFEARFNQGDLVVVRDERNKRALAVCRALMSSEDAANTQRGKILENIHYTGDKYWQLSRKLIELTR